jgi:hypothetical protein
MSANGKEIAEYIAQRKDDYTKAKEREREAAKVRRRKSLSNKIIINSRLHIQHPRVQLLDEHH